MRSGSWNYSIVEVAKLIIFLFLKEDKQNVFSIAFPADIYLFKVSNKNIRTMNEICSKLTIKDTRATSVLVFILLTLNN